MPVPGLLERGSSEVRPTGVAETVGTGNSIRRRVSFETDDGARITDCHVTGKFASRATQTLNLADERTTSGAMKKNRRINYFKPSRLLIYALSLVPFSIAGYSVSGLIWNVRQWVWLQDAIEVNADTVSYRHVSGKYGRTVFTYSYTLDGQQFTNSTQDVGPFLSRTEADRIVEVARAGGPVACYVNSQAHDQAMLSRNVSYAQVFAGLGFTTAFAFGGSCLVFAGVSRRYADSF